MQRRNRGLWEAKTCSYYLEDNFFALETDLFDICNSPVMYCFELLAFYACYHWSTSFFSKSVGFLLYHISYSILFYLSKMWATLIPKSKHIPFRPVVVIHESNGGDLCLLSKERTVGQRRLKSSPSPSAVNRFSQYTSCLLGLKMSHNNVCMLSHPGDSFLDQSSALIHNWVFAESDTCPKWMRRRRRKTVPDEWVLSLIFIGAI